jgi:hypothetical protein
MKVAASNTTAFLAGVVFGAAIFGADVAIDRGPDDAGTSLSTIVVISGLSVLVAPLILVFVSGQGLPRLIEPSQEIVSYHGQMGLLRRVALWALGAIVSLVLLARGIGP